eukprot:TRINITY_DN62930_c0_g1_i1.p1 TRINITY_DN62930_c0_g1~~TRINITY_DN62930_c0_g1_i1.p1  ORF type:complete len:394 (-),score=58.96 TRINITY_DN62930_c0_g1_i1:9-1190(-)
MIRHALVGRSLAGGADRVAATSIGCRGFAHDELSRGPIVGLGSSVLDMLFRVRSLPVSGTKGYFRDPAKVMEGSVVGGVTLNHLSWASLLSTPTALAALQGVDPYGHEIRAKMAELGVSAKFLQADSRYSTAVSHIYLDDEGERTIMMATGSSGVLNASTFDSLFGDIVRNVAGMVTAEVCHVPLSAVARMVELAREKQIVSCIDVDVPPSVAAGDARLGSHHEMLAIVSGCTVLKPTLEAAAELLALHRSNGDCPEPAKVGLTLPNTSDEVAGLLQEAFGSRMVAVTDGKHGCGLASMTESGEVFTAHVPAHAGVTQLDSTGAGDAFFGGLVAGLYHAGLPASCNELKNLGTVGASLGASCCEVLGALPGPASSKRALELLPSFAHGWVRPM